MPDAGWAIIGHPPTLSQERDPLLVSTSPENVSTRHQWFAHARLRDPHLTGIACLFPQRSRQWLLTDAAWGGLKPAPESRLRRACPSSSIQLRKPDGLAFVTHDPLIFRQCNQPRDVAVLLNRGSYVEQYDRRIEEQPDTGEECSKLS